jgi:hypothetical protein
MVVGKATAAGSKSNRRLTGTAFSLSWFQMWKDPLTRFCIIRKRRFTGEDKRNVESRLFCVEETSQILSLNCRRPSKYTDKDIQKHCLEFEHIARDERKLSVVYVT